MQSFAKHMRCALVIVPLALALSQSVLAETVARYGISMADIPLTTG